MEEQRASGLEKAADILEDVNAIVAQFIPMVGPFMGVLGAVLKLLKKPNLDPALRKQAIDAIRTNFARVGLTADEWLAAHGYDADGNKL